ncbi:MAG TPA: HAMP domain-containing histidine kinase [Romboutsia timonensis]|uniref:histidine kinase n=1 Tax=Romboutsia timonensis TaxID=1776391 RepID=A0A921MZ55_9FIRM|nr:HAMP domain-containing histidine kinase [Romboutsia timonensis]
MLHFEGLRKKVIKNYFIIIIITVTLFEGLFIFYVQNYYYDSVRQSLKSQVEYTNSVYNNSINNIENTTFDEKISNILEKQRVVGGLKYAIQVINKDKYIIIDQYGIKKHEKIEAEDVDKALKSIKDVKDLSPITHKIKSTNEHVMSISVPIKINNVIEGAIRYSVSLNEIDATIFKLALGLIIAGIFILIIAISLSLRFAETIIQPLIELKEFANELAHGNFSIKLKDTSISDDEIGDLAKTFVYMASEIDKSEKLKEEFISSISHELRTPLTSIKGWSETLGYEGITRDELDLGLGIIQDETERLIKLVEELLDFSRLASDRIKLKIDTVNIKSLAIGVMNQLKVKSSEKDIRLNVAFENENIDLIQGDKDRLRQVLINLIQNSIKFTDEGGFINIIVSQDEEYTIIKVVDNGAGIEKENLEKVLDKFFQEDYNESGSGLGLAISNEIVKLHGGKMTLNSKKGVGTSITVKIKNTLVKAI